MLLWQWTAPVGPMALAAAFVFWTLLTVGGLLDGRRWAVPAEVARLVALGAVLVAWVAGAL
jgi:hypothetical protein